MAAVGSAEVVTSVRAASGEQEQRRRLDAMDPDAVRALAASMPVIEQAKGVLMGCFGVDADGAFAILRRVSSTRHVKLRDLAAVVVDAASSRTGLDRATSTSPREQVRRALMQAQDGTQGDPGGQDGPGDDGPPVRAEDEEDRT